MIKAFADQVLLFNDTVNGAQKARVILRAVNLLELEALLEKGHAAKGHREELARKYAFGVNTSP